MKDLAQNLKELKSKIATLKAENLKDTTSLSESQAANSKYEALVQLLISEGFESKKGEKIFEDMRKFESLIMKAKRTKEIKSYEETLKMDLMIVPTRYVLLGANQKIVSPAGFHPDSRVYTKPEGTVILTNILPRSSNLSYYDLKDM